MKENAKRLRKSALRAAKLADEMRIQADGLRITMDRNLQAIEDLIAWAAELQAMADEMDPPKRRRA